MDIQVVIMLLGAWTARIGALLEFKTLGISFYMQLSLREKGKKFEYANITKAMAIWILDFGKEKFEEIKK